MLTGWWRSCNLDAGSGWFWVVAVWSRPCHPQHRSCPDHSRTRAPPHWGWWGFQSVARISHLEKDNKVELNNKHPLSFFKEIQQFFILLYAWRYLVQVLQWHREGHSWWQVLHPEPVPIPQEEMEVEREGTACLVWEVPVVHFLYVLTKEDKDGITGGAMT